MIVEISLPYFSTPVLTRAVDGEVYIGRSIACEIRLPLPTLSRRHARLYQDPGGRWLVDDLGSLNGTFVNGAQVGKAHPINPGDVINVGRPQGPGPDVGCLIKVLSTCTPE